MEDLESSCVIACVTIISLIRKRVLWGAKDGAGFAVKGIKDGQLHARLVHGKRLAWSSVEV